ncbi:hypothetical protein L3139_23095, partial [[Brevibacterium] frigoritolerans]
EINVQIVQAIKIDKLDFHRVCLQSETINKLIAFFYPAWNGEEYEGINKKHDMQKENIRGIVNLLDVKLASDGMTILLILVPNNLI